MSVVAPSSLALRVLVIDSDEQEITGTFGPLMQSLAGRLAPSGAEFRLAADRSSALEIAAAFLPKIVLIDLSLPRLEGFHIARQMRQPVVPNPIWLVAGSPFGDTAYRTLARDAGFDDFVMKPYTQSRIQGVLEKYLNSIGGGAAAGQPGNRIDAAHSTPASR
jgi:DNA-binding response OmpR family regulator